MNNQDTHIKRCPYCLYPLGALGCEHCGAADHKPNVSDLLPVGTILAGRYMLGSAVHTNSEATLYAAYDSVSHAVLLLREYFPKSLADRRSDGTVVPKTGKEVQFKALRMDFEEVCRYLSRQRPDMCLIPCIDVLPYGETVYGIFEEPQGRKLEDYLDICGGRLPWTEVKKPFLQMLSTVSTFNRTGIIHRGISPTTLHWDNDRRLLLTGFGTSAFRTGHGEIEAELFYGYAAPEQYTQRGWQGTWTDVYALGAVLYRTLTGHRPEDYHGRLTGEQLVPPEDFDPTIPHHVSDAIMHAMTLEVGDRYQTADDFYTGLLEAAASNTAIFEASDMPPQRKRPQKRRGALIGGLAGGVVAIALALFLAIQSGFVPAFGPDGQSSSSDISEDPPVESDFEPDPEPGPEPVIIPNFVGMQYDDAARIAKQNAYPIDDRIVEDWNDEVAEGIVMAQYPEGDTELSEGGKIRFTVSMGSENAVMPNIVGWTIDEAKEQLDILGIPYGVLESSNADYIYGIVERATIDAGTEFSRRTTTVYLYTGRKQQ